MSILVFSLLFFPVIICGLSIYVFKIKANYLKLLTAFSGAYLLTICFIEVLPEIYSQSNSNNIYIGIFILIGFFIQLLLDFVSKGVEHGHQHIDCNCHKNRKLNPLPVLIGLCIHAFLEGMPLSDGFMNSELRNTLLLGIIIHNIPISIVLMSLFIHNQHSKTTPIILLIIFALASPFGALCSYFLGMEFINNINQYFSAIMAIVVGIFLHISTTILFETDENHKFNYIKLFVVIIGASAAFIISIIHI